MKDLPEGSDLRRSPTTAASRLLLLGVALLIASIPSPATACSCMATSLAGSYSSYAAVFAATIDSEATVGSSRYYVATVKTGYKGCFRNGERVTLVTHVDGATCGVQLTVGDAYLVTAKTLFVSLYSINLCGYNRPVASLAPAEVKFLDTRFNCGSCVNSDRVACLVNPCDNVSCPDGECVANYCGGCNAEFYDKETGSPVCQPCATQADCGWGQVCGPEKRCRAACAANEDCEKGAVCGPDKICLPASASTLEVSASTREASAS